MVSIRFDDQELDLYKSTGISYVLNNPLNQAGDYDKIRLNFSFPVTLPLSPNNNKIFGYPAEIDNINKELKTGYCHIYKSGILLFEGEGHLSEPNNHTVKLTIIANPMQQLKETMLSELDLGSQSFASLSAILAHAKDTVVNPLNHNYAFLSVWNPFWFNYQNAPDTNPGDPYYDWIQNYYDPATGAFISHAKNKAAMPFLRVDFVLQKLCEKIGYTIDNQWQTTDELKQLYLYNNVSLYDGDAWGTDINLFEHVPAEKCSELLKNLAWIFNFGIFPDIYAKTIKIIPAKTIITNSVQYDWTYAEDRNFQVLQDDKRPGNVVFSPNPNDKMVDQWPYKAELKDLIIAEVEKFSDFNTGMTHGYYYVKSHNSYYVYNPTTDTATFFHKQFEKLDLQNPDSESDLNSSLVPLFMEERKPGSTISRRMPFIKLNGRMKDLDQGEASGLRMLFYRGFYTNIDSESMPLSSNNVYDFNDTKITGADHALLMNGDYGIYEKWHKDWIEHKVRSKSIKRKFALHIKDLYNFSMEDKIKSGNFHYLVDKLKINLSNDSGDTVEVEAELSTILI